MSTTLFTNASPFAAALPASHMFFEYDADGDCIMTDASTGLPITYGYSKRHRGSFDSDDSSDSRPSKRSRISSDDGGATSTSSSSLSIKTPRAAVGIASDECPPAPKKLARMAFDEDDDDDNHSVLRNLAETMAEAVLVGEPLSPITAWETEDTVYIPTTTTSSSNAASIPLPESDTEEEHWCVSVKCADLALRLDMRHPRVILNFLRFVHSYNELAPADEMINLPCIEAAAYKTIVSHESVTNPPLEFQDQVCELHYLLDRHVCQCPDCQPENWSDYGRGDDEDEHDSDDSRDSRDSYGGDSY